MAITTEKSTQITNATARPPVIMDPVELHGRVRIGYFNFTQGVLAGDAGSTADLVNLPGGKVRVLVGTSPIAWSAFGAARVLDIGYKSYTSKTDGSTVAASALAFDNDIDVSVAGTDNMGSDITGLQTFTFESLSGVTLYATVAGGTIPAAATLNGYFLYVID